MEKGLGRARKEAEKSGKEESGDKMSCAKKGGKERGGKGKTKDRILKKPGFKKRGDN